MVLLTRLERLPLLQVVDHNLKTGIGACHAGNLRALTPCTTPAARQGWRHTKMVRPKLVRVTRIGQCWEHPFAHVGSSRANDHGERSPSWNRARRLRGQPRQVKRSLVARTVSKNFDDGGDGRSLEAVFGVGARAKTPGVPGIQRRDYKRFVVTRDVFRVPDGNPRHFTRDEDRFERASVAITRTSSIDSSPVVIRRVGLPLPSRGRAPRIGGAASPSVSLPSNSWGGTGTMIGGGEVTTGGSGRYGCSFGQNENERVPPRARDRDGHDPRIASWCSGARGRRMVWA